MNSLTAWPLSRLSTPTRKSRQAPHDPSRVRTQKHSQISNALVFVIIIITPKSGDSVGNLCCIHVTNSRDLSRSITTHLETTMTGLFTAVEFSGYFFNVVFEFIIENNDPRLSIIIASRYGLMNVSKFPEGDCQNYWNEHEGKYKEVEIRGMPLEGKNPKQNKLSTTKSQVAGTAWPHTTTLVPTRLLTHNVPQMVINAGSDATAHGSTKVHHERLNHPWEIQRELQTGLCLLQEQSGSSLLAQTFFFFSFLFFPPLV